MASDLSAFPGTQPPADNQPAGPVEAAPLLERNPAPVQKMPLVQLFPPLLKPDLDYFIEEQRFVKPLEVAGLLGTALVPMNKYAMLKGEQGVVAADVQSVLPDVTLT